MGAADCIAKDPADLRQPDAMRAPVSSLDAAEPPRAPRAIWMLGALGAILIHAGCVALAVDYLQPDDASDDLGAPAIEIGLELEAPRHDPVNLPPGPDADASAASPVVMEQKTEVERTDLPKATPTETEDPDRVVAPEETNKPEDDQPKTPAVQTAPSEASVAAEATAMPSPQTAQEAPRSTAPDLGTGESLRRARATWQRSSASTWKSTSATRATGSPRAWRSSSGLSLTGPDAWCPRRWRKARATPPSTKRPSP